MNNYYVKYIKYKKKYLDLLRNQNGGNLEKIPIPAFPGANQKIKPIIEIEKNENLDFFLNYNNSTFNKEINQKYNNFFYNLEESIIYNEVKNIGAPSANSFNSKIKLKNKYDSNNFDVILKLSRQLFTDNNYYEFYAGKCINLLKHYVPNFVYTFHHIFLTPELKYKLSESYGLIEPRHEPIAFRDILELKKGSIFTNLEADPNNISKISNGCIYNDRSAVLIENIPNNMTFEKILEDPDFILDKNYNLFCILFQLYAALTILENNFTHYDLHTDNVLFIKLNAPIKIKYNIYDITIQTQFIPIILDYGRAFVDCTEFNTSILSSVFSEIACASSWCNLKKNNYPECSVGNYGINVTKDISNNYSNNSHFINFRRRNHSHDLRYVNILVSERFEHKEKIWTLDIYEKLAAILNITNNPEWFEQYNISTNSVGYNLKYGVPEQNNQFNPMDPHNTTNKIKTVVDMFNWLIKYYFENKYNERIDPVNLYGILNINIFIKSLVPWTFELIKKSTII